MILILIMNENIFPFEFISKLQDDLNLKQLKEDLTNLFENDFVSMFDFSLFVLEEKLID